MNSFKTSYSRRPAMGTFFEVFLVGDDEEHLEAVAAAVLDEVCRLDRLLSRFDPAAEVARVNREAALRSVRIDTDLWDILCRCQEHRRATGGCFDVTAASSGQDGEALILDEERRTMHFARPGVSIDLGGFAKGYALDRAAEIMRRFRVASALLHGGTSSILAVGCRPDGGPWPVAIRDPFRADLSAAVPLSLQDQGFSCSAALRPGQTTSDVIAPHGQPLAEQAACLVVAPTAAEAEVFSTACLVMGKGRAREYLEKNARPGLSVGWIDAPDGRPRLDWLKETP